MRREALLFKVQWETWGMCDYDQEGMTAPMAYLSRATYYGLDTALIGLHVKALCD